MSDHICKAPGCRAFVSAGDYCFSCQRGRSRCLKCDRVTAIDEPPNCRTCEGCLYCCDCWEVEE